MSDEEIKCFSCPNKPGTIKIKDAKKCKGCGVYYHPSCAARAGVTAHGYYLPCCSKRSGKTSPRPNMSKQSDENSRTQSVNEDALVSTQLDPTQLALWELMKDKFDIICSKIDNANAKLEVVNRKVDSLETRTSVIEAKQDVIKDEVLCEMNVRRIKERNVIIFNLQDTPSAGKNDLETVKNILMESGLQIPFSLDGIRVHRIGAKFTEGKIRPLRIILPSADNTSWFFGNKQNLAKGSLIIKSDLTSTQLSYLKKLQNELKSRMDNGEQNLTIKYIMGNPTIVQKKNNEQ